MGCMVDNEDDDDIEDGGLGELDDDESMNMPMRMLCSCMVMMSP